MEMICLVTVTLYCHYYYSIPTYYNSTTTLETRNCWMLAKRTIIK